MLWPWRSSCFLGLWVEVLGQAVSYYVVWLWLNETLFGLLYRLLRIEVLDSLSDDLRWVVVFFTCSHGLYLCCPPSKPNAPVSILFSLRGFLSLRLPWAV